VHLFHSPTSDHLISQSGSFRTGSSRIRAIRKLWWSTKIVEAVTVDLSFLWHRPSLTSIHGVYSNYYRTRGVPFGAAVRSTITKTSTLLLLQTVQVDYYYCTIPYHPMEGSTGL